jgi:hypothetical protein
MHPEIERSKDLAQKVYSLGGTRAKARVFGQFSYYLRSLRILYSSDILQLLKTISQTGGGQSCYKATQRTILQIVW